MTFLARVREFLRVMAPRDVGSLSDEALQGVFMDPATPHQLRVDVAEEIVRRAPRRKPAHIVIDGPVCREVQGWIAAASVETDEIALIVTEIVRPPNRDGDPPRRHEPERDVAASEREHEPERARPEPTPPRTEPKPDPFAYLRAWAYEELLARSTLRIPPRERLAIEDELNARNQSGNTAPRMTDADAEALREQLKSESPPRRWWN